jgi:hypothetical protein
MPEHQESCSCASGVKHEREDTPVNQFAMILVYREDQLKMERRLAHAEMKLAHMEIRLSELEGRPVEGWKVTRPRPESRSKRTRGW